MYVIDDVCYAGKIVTGIKVIGVEPLQGRIMLVTFSTGEIRLFDIAELSGSAFKVLEDEKIFNNPAIFHGAITWDNGNVDIAPEAVYEKSYEYTTEGMA